LGRLPSIKKRKKILRNKINPAFGWRENKMKTEKVTKEKLQQLLENQSDWYILQLAFINAILKSPKSLRELIEMDYTFKNLYDLLPCKIESSETLIGSKEFDDWFVESEQQKARNLILSFIDKNL
jgi:hypothetical protein